MRTLSTTSFDQARESIIEYARPLEKAVYKHFFLEVGDEETIRELDRFQNPDGGFGHGLEPDFRMPDSSPAATAVAFQTIMLLDDPDSAVEMIKPAIEFLDQSFDEETGKWFNVSDKVNQYPHAPWWHYDPDTGQTALDHVWGNPSAELVGHLHRFSEFTNLNSQQLVVQAIEQLRNKESYSSEHEIFSYIRLYHLVEDNYKEQLEDHIVIAIDQLLETNINNWDNYVPKPLDFVSHPSHHHFGMLPIYIGNHLEYLINQLDNRGRILPTWSWADSYPDAWEQAHDEWVGILTLDALRILQNFDRIDEK